ncbi:MAG: thiol:disulfide interchange protein DsbA/DsbL [Gammaproteobacteria bacterium]|nr:thiol:disulfide interchange protein DsbA/DsbL [Gammaproteobacteria bacterium]
MTSIRNLLTVATVMLIVACGDKPESTQAESAPPAPAATAEAPAPAPETMPIEKVVESVVDETVAEADEQVQAEEELVLAQAAETQPKPAVAQKYSEGQHYSVLTTAQGTSSSPDVVEVAEVFWYGCPHCYNFDPYIVKWEEELPDGVELVRLPVMWNPTNEIHARMFYTADALGVLDEMHTAIFKEMHLNQKQLTSESDIEALFGTYGVSSEDFQKTFRSFPVETKLKKAKSLTQRYRIQSVPLLVVNGKYVVTGPGIKNFEDMIAVGEELIAVEQAEL